MKEYVRDSRVRKIGMALFLICIIGTIFVLANRIWQPGATRVSGIVEHQSLEDLMTKSDLVMEGSVTDISEGFWVRNTSGGERIQTDYSFNVNSVLKGEAQEKVTVRMDGGSDDQEAIIYEDAPKLKIGKTYTLFLYRPQYGGGYYTKGDYYNILGMRQGVYTKTADADYLTQGEDKVLKAEFTQKLEETKNEKRQPDSFLQERYQNLKANLDSGFITQEEYDTAMRDTHEYAEIIEKPSKRDR